MLLAEELALVAINPDSGRHAIGYRDVLNACLAGLLIAEVALDAAGQPTDPSPVLDAAAEVLAEKRGKPKPALSHMSRGLDQRLGLGTWDAVVDGLVRAGVLGPSEGNLMPKHELLDPGPRDAIIERLRAAAASDDPMDARTAIVLSMTGPGHLLELVAPDRKTRKHARKRIDHGLDDTDLGDVGQAVRRVLADAQAAVIAATTAASIAAVSGSS
jgi:hypothetical protein